MKSVMNKEQIYVYRIILIFFLGVTIYLSAKLLTAAKLPAELNMSLLYLNCCTLLPLMYKIRRPFFNLFDPVYIYGFLFYFFYVFSSVVVYNSDKEWESSLIVNIYEYNIVITLNYYLGVSIFLFYCAYFFITRNIKFDIHLFDKEQKFSADKILFCLYLFSLAFRMYGYLTGHMGSLAGLQDRGFKFPGVSILLFISNIWFVYYSYFTIRYFFAGEHKRMWIVFTILEFLFVLIGGDRRYIIEVALIVISVYYYKKKTLPWKKILIGVPLFFFVFVPITSVYGYLLETTNGSLSESVGLMSAVFDMLSVMSPIDLIQDYVIFPLFSQSLFQIPTCQTAYQYFDLRGVHWGAVPFQHMANQVLPSFLIERMDARVYINAFGFEAKRYVQEYSSMTFLVPQEIITCYGLRFLPLFYVFYGLLIGWLYKVLVKGRGFTKVLYVASLFCLGYCFHFGFLTTELTTPLRVLCYYGIYKFIMSIYHKRMPRLRIKATRKLVGNYY